LPPKPRLREFATRVEYSFPVADTINNLEGRYDMKSQDRPKSAEKKKPQKTLKEKRAEKKSKKESKSED